ncbi:LacI family DNA-binding transcriptional regulator [Pedobacter sp. Leaf176]|uniref:LacI family DNA-binding transcriptional regulator n=1 Tax=Pedobacter sp. Leaf176 TaxID=1736286 RepID=UPI0006F232FF|nr:LacI family DNA-binding transcriptional regulator [Pedobacter sp. Leaf176]KQR66841.1 hypothetical protein ASF92_18985 [Pedobacter sp. Leaf176]
MKKKVSIKDIAQLSGTSITTVSFVLNGKTKEKHISTKLSEKILDIVKELDYHPNSFARSLRTGKSKTIGFLVDDISTPFFSAIARVIDLKAADYGYKIIFSSTGNHNKRIREILNMYKERNVDGYIIAVAEGIEEEIGELINLHIPVVLFDRYLPELKVDYVLTDNYDATSNATEHLINQGYKKIAFITVNTTQFQMHDRLNGYTNALRRAKYEHFVLKIDYLDSNHSTEMIREFLAHHEEVDAVIFATNYLTMDGLKLARKNNLELLTSKAVISFDDFELLEFIKPSITAIEQSIEEIGTKIIQELLKKLENGTTAQSNTVFNIKAKLNIRQSTAGGAKN